MTTTASIMNMGEIYDALIKRLIALGTNSSDAPGRAATMLIGWDKFTDAGSDALGTGGRTVDMWMDREVVRLLDAGLRAYYIGKQAYPAVSAREA
jgi:hypothetical protein